MKMCLCVTATALMSLLPVLAQQRLQGPFVVRGEIVSGRPPARSLTIEMSGAGMMPSESVSVNPDNTFELRSVTPGTYELRVVDNAGQVLHQEIVNISSPTQVLSIRVDEPPDANRSAGGVISLQQLRHKVPPKARKAFDDGEQALSKGDLAKARTSFQDALSIDPEFADAHNELGGVEAGLNHLPEAAEQFQKAIDLVPEHPLAVHNLSVALAKMDRLQEAAQAARHALQIDPSDGRMHYIIAVSLLQEHGATEEVTTEFERAVSSVRAAHIILAKLLANQGRVTEAREHLETYLSNSPPNDPLRPRAEAQLAALRQ